jgi:hypothetical protein
MLYWSWNLIMFLLALISGEVQAVGQNSGSEAQWMLSSQQAQPTSGQQPLSQTSPGHSP